MSEQNYRPTAEAFWDCYARKLAPTMSDDSVTKMLPMLADLRAGVRADAREVAREEFERLLSGIEVIEVESADRLVRGLGLAGPEPRGLIPAWCPQCGPLDSTDEDGCCSSCGADASGPGVPEVRELLRRRGESTDPIEVTVTIMGAEVTREGESFLAPEPPEAPDWPRKLYVLTKDIDRVLKHEQYFDIRVGADAFRTGEEAVVPFNDVQPVVQRLQRSVRMAGIRWEADQRRIERLRKELVAAKDEIAQLSDPANWQVRGEVHGSGDHFPYRLIATYVGPESPAESEGGDHA